MKTILICLSLISCLVGWEGDRWDTTIQDFDTLIVNIVLTVNGKAYFFDSTFWIDPTLVDTNFRINTGTELLEDGDVDYRFGRTVGFDIHILGNNDAGDIRWDGHELRMDFDADADTVYIYMNGTNGLLRYITATDQWEFLESTWWLAGDSIYWVDASGVDTNWVTNTGSVLEIGGNGNNVLIKDGVSNVINFAGSNIICYAKVSATNGLTVTGLTELKADTNFIAYNSAVDDSTFCGFISLSKFALTALAGVNNMTANHEARFGATNNQTMRMYESGGNYYVQFLGLDFIISRSDTDTYLGTSANRFKEIWTLRYMGTDPSKADSFGRYDDGDTNRIWAKNPIKVGNSVIIDSNGTVTIPDSLLTQGIVMFITGTDTGFIEIVNDTLRINGNIPIKVGAGSVIIANDCVTISTELLVDGDLVFGADGGLSFGEIYVQGNTNATDIQTTNVWEQFVDFTNDGQSNNCSPDATSNHILITEAGIYQVMASVSFTGGKDDQYEVQIYKNDGATALPNLYSTRFINNTGEYGSVSISGLADFAVNDSIELWIRDVTNNTDAILKDVNLSLIQIGK